MDQQQQSRWRTIRRWFLWISGIVVALALVISLYGGYRYGWHWTGVGQPDKFSKRTLWDWLQLLIIPSVLALGGYLFTRSENRRTQETANQQRDLDRELADERQQDDMLQAYLDGMSQLLTDKERPLRRAQSGDNLSTVARARTLTVLARLDGGRKATIVQFLYESGLITGDVPIIQVGGANLRGVDLAGTRWQRINLTSADLRTADLRAELSVTCGMLHCGFWS